MCSADQEGLPGNAVTSPGNAVTSAEVPMYTESGHTRQNHLVGREHDPPRVLEGGQGGPSAEGCLERWMGSYTSLRRGMAQLDLHFHETSLDTTKRID